MSRQAVAARAQGEARIKAMCDSFREKAHALVEENLQGSEVRGQEIYDQTVHNVQDKLAVEFVRQQGEIKKNLQIREAQIKNNVKLEVLKSQTEAIHEALRQALVELNKFSEGPKYPELLKKMIIEGLVRLQESRVRLMVRQKDLPIAQQVLEEAVRIAQKHNPDIGTKIKIDERRFLPQAPACAGGVVMIADKGKIRVSNVLNDRLRLAYEGMLPMIRHLVLDDEKKT
jgi:V-type H+-transporting ATPase subunit E